jgi:hypothetical protein
MAGSDDHTTMSEVPVTSFSCEGCDCGACGTDAVRDLMATTGVVHVRLDRARRTFVVRHVAAAVDARAIERVIEFARLSLRD